MITARIASNRRHNLIRPTMDGTVDMKARTVANSDDEIDCARRLVITRYGDDADMVLRMLGIESTP